MAWACIESFATCGRMPGLWRACTTDAVRGTPCAQCVQFPGGSIRPRSLGLHLCQATTSGDGGARSQWSLWFPAVSYDRQVERDQISCRHGIVCQRDSGVEIVLLPFAG